MRRPAGFAVIVVPLLLLGSLCGRSVPHVAPTTSVSEQCDDAPGGATRVILTASDGAILGAARLGSPTSPVGVVINYGASQTLCDWLDIGADLAAAGAQVLVFDRRGRGASPGPEKLPKAASDVVTAANWLSEHGVRRTVLLGSSLGTLGAFIGASPSGPQVAVTPSEANGATLAKPPCGVILISPITSTADDGGSLDSLRVRQMRSRIWIAHERDNTVIAADADALARTATAAGGTVVENLSIPGKDHGRQLIWDHPEVPTMMADAVHACA